MNLQNAASNWKPTRSFCWVVFIPFCFFDESYSIRLQTIYIANNTLEFRVEIGKKEYKRKEKKRRRKKHTFFTGLNPRLELGRIRWRTKPLPRHYWVQISRNVKEEYEISLLFFCFVFPLNKQFLKPYSQLEGAYVLMGNTALANCNGPPPTSIIQRQQIWKNSIKKQAVFSVVIISILFSSKMLVNNRR